MSKKVLTVFLCLAMILAFFAGCGKEDKKEEGSVEFEKAALEDVQAALEDENSIVIDARLNDIYSGWDLDDIGRGGHIKGAVDFAANNITCEYDDENNLEGLTREEVLSDMMKNKGITSDKKVIIYDTNGKDAQTVAEYFSSKGIEDITLYDANEWIKDSSLEMESYPNYEMLVPASVVKEITDGNVPEGFTDCEEIKIIDVRWGTNEDSGYLDGHIPTAVHVNTDEFEPPADLGDGVVDYRLTDDDALLALALKSGITSDDCVIMTSPEPMAACRYAVICKYLGVEDVRVMSSGFIGWTSAGYELETTENEPVAETDFGVEVPANEEWIDTIAETQAALAGDNYTLVDNRTWEEYIGEDTGYSYHKIAGRIEGAVYGMAGIDDSSSMYYYRNVDKSMRNADEILSMWQDECGIDTNTRMAFMCGGGWRAAEILWDAKVMGLDNTTLYSDGWCAWSNDGLPYITGE